jgi:hypothetical protein
MNEKAKNEEKKKRRCALGKLETRRIGLRPARDLEFVVALFTLQSLKF